MKKEHCVQLMMLWQELDSQEGRFRLTGWLTDEGEVAANQYEEHIASWKEDAPVREQYREARANEDETSGVGGPANAPSGTSCLLAP